MAFNVLEYTWNVPVCGVFGRPDTRPVRSTAPDSSTHHMRWPWIENTTRRPAPDSGNTSAGGVVGAGGTVVVGAVDVVVLDGPGPVAVPAAAATSPPASTRWPPPSSTAAVTPARTSTVATNRPTSHRRWRRWSSIC